ALDVGIDRRVQKYCIRVRRLETPDIEGWRKIVGENARVDADRAVEFIVVQKVAAAARDQRRLVAKRCERKWEAGVEPACALLEQIVGARTEARARQARQQ